MLWLNETDLRLELDQIPASLSPGVDVGRAAALPANQDPKVCFQGQTPGVTDGFVLDADLRAQLVARDPRCADYIHSFLGGNELLHRTEIDRWVIDLPHNDAVAAERDAPVLMDHLRRHVLPVREEAAAEESARNEARRAANAKHKGARHHGAFLDQWWVQAYRRTDMLAALSGRVRYIAASRVSSEQRATVFTFVDTVVRPGDSVVALAFDDLYSFGILHSSLHRRWFEARCSRLETRLRYTSSTVFDSFPWPQSPDLGEVAAVEQIIDELLAVRADNLAAGMTLARQYDALRQPGRSRLRTLHDRLDTAVIAAYGFSTDDDPVAQLLALNLDLAGDPAGARGPGRPTRKTADAG